MMPKDAKNLEFYQNKITDFQAQVQELQNLNKFFMLKLSHFPGSK